MEQRNSFPDHSWEKFLDLLQKTRGVTKRTISKLREDGIEEQVPGTVQQIQEQLAFQISQLKRPMDIDEVLFMVRSLGEYKINHEQQD